MIVGKLFRCYEVLGRLAECRGSLHSRLRTATLRSVCNIKKGVRGGGGEKNENILICGSEKRGKLEA